MVDESFFNSTGIVDADESFWDDVEGESFFSIPGIEDGDESFSTSTAVAAETP